MRLFLLTPQCWKPAHVRPLISDVLLVDTEKRHPEKAVALTALHNIVPLLWLIIHDSCSPHKYNSCASKPTINVNILAEFACLFFQQVKISITPFGFPAISAGGTRGVWLND
ncbi:hypothetical protein AVEN_205362-1 [Araneus ventricosus]|uniref:Uncharacterized protein n=1 Tax=Araneus ventricosus TaxID=182803 RepID=A0A4Y2CGM6_ARAVE|nr:hypothetical protein AVEN_139014-1 [Araneus ventricosus]GBM03561.1 hypothetical protein AVEN_205362-1 [Araneus ventricosus]